jgi:DNA-binding IscR family transcriptional regulator
VVPVVAAVVVLLVLLTQTGHQEIQIKDQAEAVEIKPERVAVIFQPLAEQVGQALSY